MSKARSPRADCSTTVGIRDWCRGSCSIGVLLDGSAPQRLGASAAISYSRYYQRDNRISAKESSSVNERRHEPVFPGFREMAAERRALTGALVSRRVELGLSQTEVAARMGTSQSAVARIESGDADVRLSTLERYAAALGQRLDWRLEERER